MNSCDKCPKKPTCTEPCDILENELNRVGRVGGSQKIPTRRSNYRGVFTTPPAKGKIWSISGIVSSPEKQEKIRHTVKLKDTEKKGDIGLEHLAVLGPEGRGRELPTMAEVQRSLSGGDSDFKEFGRIMGLKKRDVDLLMDRHFEGKIAKTISRDRGRQYETKKGAIQKHYCPVKELKKRGSEPACCGIVSLA